MLDVKNNTGNIIHEATTEVQTHPNRETGTKKISYFRQKYEGKVINAIELNLEHPYVKELTAGFNKHVVGQEKAKKVLAESVVDCILRLGEPTGPIGVFFFSGPTGVGKTEIVKGLADFLFGDPNGFIKLEGEQLMESHHGSKIFGSPPGYIGFDKVPKLTNKSITLAYDVAKQMKRLHKMVANMPWISILLVDEAEKIHPDILQQFLSALSEGKVSVSNGEVVNLQNTIIVFTSNVGQKEIRALKEKNAIGFSQEQVSYQEIDKLLQKAIKEIMSPEFMGRVDAFIDFDELTQENCKSILDIQLENLNKFLLKYFTEAHLQVELSPDLYEFIIQKGFSQEKGARELVRTFNKNVKRALSRLVFSDEFAQYYEYKGEIIIGLDIDEDNIFSDIILSGGEQDFKETLLLEDKSTQPHKLSLYQLREIYSLMSAYVELVYVGLDSEVDLRDEIIEYADKLKAFGLSQNDISGLKDRAYLEGLRDLVFIQDFQELGNGSEIKDLFHPYEARTIIKIVERKFQSVYGEGHIPKKKFIIEGTKAVIGMIMKLLNVEELSGSQTSQLLFYIRKVLSEKYGINGGY